MPNVTHMPILVYPLQRSITYGAYLHPVLTSMLKKQREIYSALPPVKGFTPVEIAVAGPIASAALRAAGSN